MSGDAVESLKARVTALEAALRLACDSLEAEIRGNYPVVLHPVEERRLARDLTEVSDLRALLTRAGGSDAA